MPSFSRISREKLATCHHDLQAVMNEAIKYTDFSIICGYRGQKEQDDAFTKGLSKLKFPNGKHNQDPSLAVDIAPYPIDWKDIKRFIELKEVIFQVAGELGIHIRWGGDWNQNGSSADEKFLDLPHYELVTK
jgi:peptidoglycan L-alanyl-D-glutamate endopeptidase CwlK